MFNDWKSYTERHWTKEEKALNWKVKNSKPKNEGKYYI